jgi:hypothetical protein
MHTITKCEQKGRGNQICIYVSRNHLLKCIESLLTFSTFCYIR